MGVSVIESTLNVEDEIPKSAGHYGSFDSFSNTMREYCMVESCPLLQYSS